MASRPIGNDRWRKGGPDGPLLMSGIFKVALFPAALLQGASFFG